MNATASEQKGETAYAQALAHLRREEWAQAERLCSVAIAENQANGAWHDLLGTVLRQQGDPRCVASAQAAVAADPASALYLYNLGECCRWLNRPADAVDAYQRSLAIRQMPQTYRALGTALEQLGKRAEAAAALARSAALEPGSPLAQNRLMRGLYRAGRFADCIAAGPGAIRVAASDAEIHLLIGLSHLNLAQFPQAVEALRSSARLKPTAVCIGALAAAANGAGEYPRAASAAQEALGLAPDDIEAHKQLGIALHRLGEMTAASEHLRTTLRSNPRDGHCLLTLGNIELARLNYAEGVRLLNESRAIGGDAPAIVSKCLMVMNYAPREQEREIFTEHVTFGERLAKETAGKPTGYTKAVRGPESSARLRIGYVSPDLCEHAVACFAEALLMPIEGIDEDVVVFSDAAREDHVTRRLRAHPVTWRQTRRLSHAALADLIRQESIDILVDLAGHTADNRLELFALRPAPVQMTYLGYPNTTGLPREAMQYRITDAICDPSGRVEGVCADDFCTERLLRLPENFLCYRAPEDAPPVSERPSKRRGFVTFGSFSSMAKLNWETLGQWADLLRELPASRLVLKNHSLMDGPLCESIRRFFADRKIDPSRIDLRRGVPSCAEHLSQYAEIDIALDTFPYNGTTTICEALWMGAAVVTQSGRSHRSRVGRSILHSVGLADLATDSPSAYKAAAANLAENRDRLEELRSQLQKTMATSALMNPTRFRRRFHDAVQPG